jgi:hypothetical protein
VDSKHLPPRYQPELQRQALAANNPFSSPAAWRDATKSLGFHELDEQGRRLVVRNGHAQPRQLVTGAGAVEVVAPRVNDKRVDEATGQRKRFSSAILPPWCRKSPKVSDVLPLLYLHGLSGNDFAPTLEQFLGTSAGLSAATVTRLTTQWQLEATQAADDTPVQSPAASNQPDNNAA